MLEKVGYFKCMNKKKLINLFFFGISYKYINWIDKLKTKKKVSFYVNKTNWEDYFYRCALYTRK